MATLRGGTTIMTTGSGTASTLVLPVPSGAQTSDALIVWCFTAVTARSWTGAGGVLWTLATPQSGAFNASQVLTSTVDSGIIGGTVPITMNVAGQWGAVILAVGFPGLGPFDPPLVNSGNVGSGHVIDGGALTTVNPGDVLVWFGGVNGAAGLAPGTITPPPGYAAAAGQANASGAAERTVGLLVATQDQLVPGSVADAMGNNSASAQNIGLLVSVSGTGQDNLEDTDVMSSNDAGEGIRVIQPGAPVQAQPGPTWLAHFKPWTVTKFPPPQSVSPIQPVSSADAGSVLEALVTRVGDTDVSRRPAASTGQALIGSADTGTLTDGKLNTGTIAKTSADVLSLHDGK